MIKLGCNSLVKDRDNPGGWIDIETMIDLIHTLRLDMIDFQLDRGFPFSRTGVSSQGQDSVP